MLVRLAGSQSNQITLYEIDLAEDSSALFLNADVEDAVALFQTKFVIITDLLVTEDQWDCSLLVVDTMPVEHGDCIVRTSLQQIAHKHQLVFREFIDTFGKVCTDVSFIIARSRSYVYVVCGDPSREYS